MIKNVLHLRSSGGMLGAESVIIELCKYSSDFGYKSYLGAIKSKRDKYPEILNVADREKISNAVFEGCSSLDISCAKAIRKYIYENDINILHCHGYKENFYGIISTLGLPVIKIATNHLWKKTDTKDRVYSLMDAFFLRFFSKVVGVSDAIVTDMKKCVIKNPLKVCNGVDVDTFVPMPKSNEYIEKLGLKPDRLILGMISSLTIEKGHRFAIYALKRIVKKYPQIQLLIVGDGIYRTEIENQVLANGLNEYIVLCGERTDIPKLLSIIDIFLLPSLKEGLPMSLLEAMSSGKAVIASKVGEIENVITHNQDGILIGRSNVRELAEGICSLINNKKNIIRLGENARSTVINQFSAKDMTEKYCKLYDLHFLHN